jgi:hypothetical protein
LAYVTATVLVVRLLSAATTPPRPVPRPIVPDVSNADVWQERREVGLRLGEPLGAQEVQYATSMTTRPAKSLCPNCGSAMLAISRQQDGRQAGSPPLRPGSCVGRREASWPCAVKTTRLDMTRTEEQFAAFLDGLELVAPGITPMSDWRTEIEPGPRPHPFEAGAYAALARKPLRGPRQKAVVSIRASGEALRYRGHSRRRRARTSGGGRRKPGAGHRGRYLRVRPALVRRRRDRRRQADAPACARA